VLAASASAGPLPRLRLRFQRGVGAERCPDEAALVAAVRERLGYDPFDAGSATELSATLVAVGRDLRADIALTESSGEVSGSHRLTSRHLDCVELAAAMDLAIALAIDPIAATREASTAPPREQTPEPPGLVSPPLSPPLPVEREVAPPPRYGAVERRRWEGALGVMAVVAAAPNATLGFTLSGGLRFPWWSMAVEARGDIPASQPALGGHVSTALLLFGLVPCVHASLFRFCALADVGAQFASGSDYPISRSVTAPYFAAGGRIGVDFPLGRRVLLGLHADVLGTVTRLVLRVEDQVVFRSLPVSGLVGATVGSHWL
jgi:hypothetical protein